MMMKHTALMSVLQIRCLVGKSELNDCQERFGRHERELAAIRGRMDENRQRKTACQDQLQRSGRAVALQAGLVLNRILNQAGVEERQQAGECARRRDDAWTELERKRRTLALDMGRKRSVANIADRQTRAERKRKDQRDEGESLQAWIQGAIHRLSHNNRR